MSQFEQLAGVITREELLASTEVLDSAMPEEYKYGDLQFDINGDKQVTVVSDDHETVVLDESSVNRIAREVGLDKYLQKLINVDRKEMIVPHLNLWYPEQNPEKHLRLLVSGGQAIMGIPNADFEHVSVEELIAGVEAVLGDHNILGYHKPYFSPKSFNFSLITDHAEMVINDHVYNAGIRVSHSIDGSASTFVEPYLFNQWCTNGCTHEHSIKGWNRRPAGRRRGDGEQAPMIGLSTWLQEAVVDAVMLFDQEVLNLQRLAGIPVPDAAPEAISKLMTNTGVPIKLQAAVMEQLDVDGFENMYDVYQAITHVETHDDHFNDHPNARGKLNKLAAHLSHHTTFCPTCSTQMDIYDTIEQLNQQEEE